MFMSIYLFKYMSPLVVTSADNQNSKILETTDWSPEKRKVFDGNKKLLETECIRLKWELNETDMNTPQRVLTGSDFPIQRENSWRGEPKILFYTEIRMKLNSFSLQAVGKKNKNKKQKMNQE